MCLRVRQSVGEAAKKSHKPDAEGFMVGWKLVTPKNEAIFYPKVGREYKVGDREEKFCRQPYTFYVKPYKFNDEAFIGAGIHLFANREHARWFRNYCKMYRPQFAGAKLIKVYYKLEDVLAYGCMNYTGSLTGKVDNLDNVVVTKIRIKSLKAC